MNILKASDIRGNWATLLSAWNADDSLDLGRMAAEIDALLAARVDGIYSNGTAGEFHTQTEAEFDRISDCLASKCNAAGMPFQIGVSHMSAQISRERLKRAVPLKPGAVQVILPDWFPVTEPEAVDFLQGMAETADGIGLVLYNPPHAKRVWNPEQIGRLVERVPQLIGLKTAGGDEAWYAAMRQHLSRISVFVPGHLLASGVACGAQGAYSNVACLNPAAAQRWTDLMRTDLPAALEVEARLRRFMTEHVAPFITEQKYCNAACDRLMACVGGWADVGWRMRWPYRSIPAEEAARLQPVVLEWIPEFAAAGVEAVPPREWGPERSGSQGGPGSTPAALSTGSGLAAGVEAVPPREWGPGRSGSPGGPGSTPAAQLPKRKHPIHLPNRALHNEPVILFLTVCTANRRPILANVAMHALLVKAWELSPEWTVGRYIVMPEHVHLFCSPARIEARGVNKWAAYWKGLISRGIQGYGPLASDGYGAADGVEAVPPREGKPSRSATPGGPGSTPAGFGVPIWQRDGWDTQLRDGEHYHEKWDYVRRNPVRKELVREPDEWPFQGELNVLFW